MAQVESIVPFILFYEAGGAKSCKTWKKVNGKSVLASYDPSKLTFEQQFNECKKTGLANDPDDNGGLTMCGVTYSTYAAYCNKKHKTASESGLKSLTYSEWLEILKTMYWNKWKADEIKDQWVAIILVDWTWASGIYGMKRPQKILGVTVDGIVGPKTLAAVNNSDAKTLFDKLHADRLKHFDEIVAKAPVQKKFLKGWRRRVNGIKYGSFDFLAEAYE